MFLGVAVALLHASLAWGAFLGSGFGSTGLAVAVRVDGQFAQDLPGNTVDDDDVEVVDEHADGQAGVGTARAWLAMQTSFDLAAQRAEGVPKVRKLEPVS